ncbi:MAG: PAT family beta-lactamase induction signal transducer AmpG, partial [Myxococcota bacterium]
WAPLMDRFAPKFLGRRRGWILISQVALALGLVGMAISAPEDGPTLIAVFAVFVAFASASQDIVIDAYSTDVLEPHERAAGASAKVMGYRFAMLVSATVTALVGDWVSWRAGYLVMAALMASAVLATLWAPRAPVVSAPRSLADAISKPLTEFFTRKRAVWLLVLVVVYKLTDAFAGTLFQAFLRQELGFSPTEIALINKNGGFAALLAGLAIGGIIMARIGLFRSLFLFGVLQALSNLVFMALAETAYDPLLATNLMWHQHHAGGLASGAFYAIAEVGKDYPLMVVSIVVENITGGMGTAVFVAFLMSLCDTRFTATQYALLSSLSSVGRTLIAPTAGPIVAATSWTTFFLITTLVAIPGLVLLLWLKPQIVGLDRRRPREVAPEPTPNPQPSS